jgi:hypothetical protein
MTLASRDAGSARAVRNRREPADSDRAAHGVLDQPELGGFGLETGPEQLEPYFVDVRVELFEDGLVVTEAEPVLAFIRSRERYCGQDLTAARSTIEEAIAHHCAFTGAKRSGVVTCRRP